MEDYKPLLLAVENAYGKLPKVRQDFELLSHHIFSRTHCCISPTTLKRLFGYLNEPVVPQAGTLHTLAKYAGYIDYEAFLQSTKGGTEEVQSNFIESLQISSDTLPADTRLRLTWLPDRVCVVRHLGEARFEVEEAVNTKLCVGDTFCCRLFIAHSPLYLDHLDHCGSSLCSYVCGKKDGVVFEVLTPSVSEQS